MRSAALAPLPAVAEAAGAAAPLGISTPDSSRRDYPRTAAANPAPLTCLHPHTAPLSQGGETHSREVERADYRLLARDAGRLASSTCEQKQRAAYLSLSRSVPVSAPPPRRPRPLSSHERFLPTTLPARCLPASSWPPIILLLLGSAGWLAWSSRSFSRSLARC
jgi:hypothetical protein